MFPGTGGSKVMFEIAPKGVLMSRSSRKSLTVLLAVLCLWAVAPAPASDAPAPAPAPSTPAVEGEIEIYIPCGVLLPFKEIIPEFRKANPDIEVKDHYDNAITLVREIINRGRRPDILVTPGAIEMNMVREKALIDEADIRPFSELSMVLVVPVKNRAGVMTVADLAKDTVKNVAIADPRFNAVGFHAKQAMEHFGVYEKIRDKLISTDDPIMAVNYVGKDKADAVIHYKTCPFQTTVTKLPDPREKYWLVQDIPVEATGTIHFYVANLNTSTKIDAARKFIDFLLSEKTTDRLEALGLPRIRKTDPPAPPPEPPVPPQVVKFGVPVPHGKVLVECYYPYNEEHIDMKEYFDTFAGRYDGRVIVRVIDFRDDEGYIEWRATGLTCGAVFINKEHAHTMMIGGEEKTVDFQKRMDVYWTREELDAAIRRHLDALK